MSSTKLSNGDDPKEYETIRMIETNLENSPDTNEIKKTEVIKRDEIILSVSMVKYFICLVSSFMILLSVSIITFTFLFNKMTVFNSYSDMDDIFVSKPLSKVKLAVPTVKLTTTTTSTTTKTTRSTATTTSSSPPMITTSLPFTTLDYSESKTLGESDFSSEDDSIW